MIDLIEDQDGDSTGIRKRLLQAYFRAGEHLQAQAAAEHLVDELVTKDRSEEALAVLLNIIPHYPRSTNLLMTLARLQRDCNHRKDSVQSFLTLIQLLQQEQRIKEAEALLGELAHIIADRSLVDRLSQQLASGQAVNWGRPLAPLFAKGLTLSGLVFRGCANWVHRYAILPSASGEHSFASFLLRGRWPLFLPRQKFTPA